MSDPALIAIVSAATFFFAMVMSLNLAIAIYRRAGKSFVVDNLVVLLLLFAVESAILLSYGIYGTVHSLDQRVRYLLTNGAYAAEVMAIAVIVHFILSAPRRMICDNAKFPAIPALLVIARSKALHWFLALAVFGSAGVAAGEHIWRMFLIIGNDKAAQNPLPPSSLMKPAGMVIGFLAGLGLLAQFLTLVYVHYRSMPDPTMTALLREFFSWKGRARVIYRNEHSRSSNATYAHLNADEWKSWFLCTMLMLLFAGNHVLRIDQPRSMTDIFWFLAAFSFVLLITYFNMRFVFFDVLVKRGILLAGLVSAICVCWYFILLPLERTVFAEGDPASNILLCIGTMLFTLLWASSYKRMEMTIDRIVFHRADYSSLLPEISSAIQQHAEPQSVISYVTSKLKTVMDAGSVVFSRSYTEPDSALRNRQFDTATVPVQTGNRLFGCLLVGKRSGGQKYLSEDLAFLDKVAGLTAGMLQNIELREERELQRRREQQLKALATEAELKALKAQINPHFLCNALNSLAQLTRKNPKGAEKAIVDLSRVFRYALGTLKRDHVKLGKEADFLEAYLAIENVRFEEKLRYRIDIPKELRECRIPPMIIQPLVENAVIHGIWPKRAGGTIVVAARQTGSKLHISVEDDGEGFDCQDLCSNDCGIGLQNVRSRITMLDSSNHLRIDSKPGAGTTVGFELALEIAEKEFALEDYLESVYPGSQY